MVRHRRIIRCAHCEVELKEPGYAPFFGPYAYKELCSYCQVNLLKSRWYRFRLSISFNWHRFLFFIVYFLSAFKPRRQEHGKETRSMEKT